MQHFDSGYAGKIVAKIREIPEEAVPRWGVMRKKDLIQHLVWVLRHALGRSVQVPDYSTWYSRTLLKRILLSGWVPVPRNLRLPAQFVKQGVTLREPGDLETLQALMEEYLALVETGEFQPAPHPYFGKMTIDEWDRLHVLHFEHHLKQFT